MCLDDQRVVLLAMEGHLTSLPQGVMDGEGICCGCQVFGVHLGETLTSRVIPTDARYWAID